MFDTEELGGRISPATLERGLYAQAGFRHKGWELLDVEDREEPEEVCQACGRRQVRFVHHLRHVDKSPENMGGRLEAGCVCAGYLIDDYVAAETRDRLARNEAGRIKRQRIVAARREQERAASERRRRERFASTWVRDSTKPTTTRQNRFTVFLNASGGSYGLLHAGKGFVTSTFASEAEAQAFAAMIEFGEVEAVYRRSRS